MIYVYIASPYGDHNGLNTRLKNTHTAMDAWHRLADAGFAPYCPLLSHFLHERSNRPRPHWLCHSLLWVDRCDCVLALGEISEGMKSEIARAQADGKPVFYSFEELGKAYGMEV
jgi:hypothetical protein